MKTNVRSCLVLGVFVLLAAIAGGTSGCASTSLAYGPFSYSSTKDVTLEGVEYERTPDGERFRAAKVSGIASTVDAIQAETAKAAVDALKEALKKVP